jgi:hypothetical protein
MAESQQQPEQQQQLTSEQQAQIRALNINDLAARYVALRDKKAEIAAAAKVDIEKLDAGMNRLEVLMLAWMRLTGVESARTPSGTPYLTKKTGATVTDREAFLRFVGADFANHSAFLTNAISKESVVTYMAAHEGVPPPGVNWYSEAAVNFKKS